MPNRNYINGRKKEYRIVNAERREGCIAQRTAGSHSFFDVISINEDKRIIRLIQCKPSTMSDKDIALILEQNKGIDGHYTVIFEVR